MKWRIPILFCWLVSGISCISENPELLRERADQLFSEGRESYDQKGPASALPAFEEALLLYRRADDPLGQARALRSIGSAHKRLGDYTEALSHLETSLDIARGVGSLVEEAKTLSNLGLVRWELAEYPEAVQVFEAALSLAADLEDVQLEASISNNLALVLDEMGDYSRSLQLYTQALGAFRQIEHPSGESFVLGNMGGVHLLLGRYQEAAGFYRQSLQISRTLGDTYSISIDLGNLGQALMGLGHFQEALETLDEALSLAEEASLSKETADWRRGKGAAYQQLGQYERALLEVRTALDIYLEAGNRREAVEASQELGSLHLFLGSVAAAEDYFRQSYELAEEVGYSRGEFLGRSALGDLEWRRGRPIHAIRHYDAAFLLAEASNDRGSMAASLIQTAVVEADRDNLTVALKAAQRARSIASNAGSPLQEDIAHATVAMIRTRQGEADMALAAYDELDAFESFSVDPELAWQIALGRGQALERAGRLKEAARAYVAATKILREVRAGFGERSLRAGYLASRTEPYEAAARLFIELDQPERALEISAALRTRAFQDLTERILESPDPERLLKRQLKDRTDHLQRLIDDERSLGADQRRTRVLELLAQELAEVGSQYRSVMAQSVADKTTNIASLQAVTQSLRADKAIVEYLVTESHLLTLVVRKTGLRARAFPISREDLESQVGLFRGLLARPGRSDWVGPGERLHRTLIGEISKRGWLSGVDRLYIVPHGVLNYLPFAALPVTDGANQRFLVQDFALSYIAGSLSFSRQEPPAAGAGGAVLAVAPTNADLPFAIDEVEGIATAVGGAQLLIGSAATEERFRKEAPQFGLIHLATHGTFNKSNPLLSSLKFSPSENDDGALDVGEILRLQLNANLVVLSACETAVGSGYFSDVPVGEDFIGLMNAFLRAGGRNVMASLWKVGDRSAMELMNRFYKQLGHESYAQTLAKAQRQLISEGGTAAHPNSWAGFVLQQQ